MKSWLEVIPPRQGGRYTREQIAEAAAHYVVLGSAEAVERITGIAHQRISYWRKEAWWDDLVARIRDDKRDELDAQLTGVVHQAVSAVADRLNDGDWVVNQGELRRIPVKMRDAMLVAAIAFDKRQISRNLPTSISETGSERLRELQAQLRAVSGRTIEGERVDGEG